MAATLILYGLALINTAKFTSSERYTWLGVLEVVTGLVCSAHTAGYTLILWTLGFGLLHIIYGLFMHTQVLGNMKEILANINKAFENRCQAGNHVGAGDSHGAWTSPA
ncbi:MAG: hypothetical protein MZV63_25275 [Marinilabiliales bacterium]|nr:hypothetical protein [Marinilabiliales bacterium]